MSKLGIFYTCFDEKKAIEYSLYELKKIYPESKIYLVSEGIDFSYLENLFENLKSSKEEDTMSATFKITDINFIEEEHQMNIKKCTLATLDRLERAIEYCNSEYILMMDPDSLVRGILNIPDGVKLLGSRVNSGFPQKLKDALAKSGAKVINNWGATPAIFHSNTFLKALNYLRENTYLLDEFTKSFYAIYAHDVLLPILFALVGEEETFNPDIIECQRDKNWKLRTNPLVHQFREFYD
jgi:hypothetical protein